jgi:hypothetical protein
METIEREVDDMYRLLETIFTIGFFASLVGVFVYYTRGTTDGDIKSIGCIGLCCVFAFLATTCKPRIIRRNGNTFNEYTPPQVRSPYIPPIEEERIRRMTAIVTKEVSRVNRINDKR